jgi:hypothetical protein
MAVVNSGTIGDNVMSHAEYLLMFKIPDGALQLQKRHEVRPIPKCNLQSRIEGTVFVYHFDTLPVTRSDQTI